MKTLIIAHGTFREAVRNKILYSVFLFAILIVGISAFFGTVSIGDQAQVIKDFGLFSISFFGTVISIIIGVNLLNKELKQKTIYNILSKPVSRWQFILGKFLGLTLTTSILVGMMGIGLVMFVALFEKRIDWLLFQGILFIILELSVVSAVTIFFSSVVITTTLTGLFTLGAYIAGRSINYLSYYLERKRDIPIIIKNIAAVLNWIVPDLSVFNISNQIVYGTPASCGHFFTASLYATSYIAIALTCSVFVFNKRELL